MISRGNNDPPPSYTKGDEMELDELDALLDQSRQLLAGTESAEATVRVPKNLMAIYQESKKLNQKIVRTVSEIEPKGDYLLAQKGFDAEKYRRNLQTLDLKSTFEPLEPLSETDIETYLRHQHSMLTLTTIEEAKKSTSNKFYKTYDTYMDANWRKAKDDFQRALQLYRNQMETLQPIIQQGLLAPQTPTFGKKIDKSSMTIHMKDYSCVVHEMNIARKHNTGYPLISNFMSCIEKSDEDTAIKRTELLDCWRFLKYILHEDASSQSSFGSSNIDTESKIYGAIRALEAQCAEYIKENVDNQKFESMKALYNEYSENIILITCFLHTSLWMQQNRGFANWEKFDGFHRGLPSVPVWALIFYCLRCGFVNDALQIAENSRYVQDRPELYNLIKLKARCSSSINVNQEAVREEFRQTTKEKNRDPYKLILYNLLGKVNEDSEHMEVLHKVEDWLWYKLHLTTKENFKKFQDYIANLGPTYFSKGLYPLRYFMLLIITQQFERAILYILNLGKADFYVEAVHFAIALLFYGQLKYTENANYPLSYQAQDGLYINYIFVLSEYVKLFAITDLHDAVSYIYTLDLLKNGQELCVEYMTRLVLQTKEITSLLGSITDSHRKKGLIETFLEPEQVLRVLQTVAAEYQRNGAYDTAVELLFMAEERERAINLVNANSSFYLRNILTIMIELLNQVLRNGSNRDLIINLAFRVNNKFERENLKYKLAKGDEKDFETFNLLLRLTNFFTLCQGERYNEAYKLIPSFDFLPLQRNQIEAAYHKFMSVGEPIRHKISEILVQCMFIIKYLYSNEKSKLSSSQLLALYRENSNALIEFAGKIQQFVTPDRKSVV